MSQHTFDFAAVPQHCQPAAPRNPLPARNSDPVSSKEAAADLVESGRQASQRMEVLVALKKHDRSTSRELATYAGLDLHMVGRRMTELARLGLVIQGEPRQCKVGNRLACEWRIA
jgi:predicted transcriptional regulator